ncbi:hypothetical protein [Bythopirellula polymerisocia]|uniref:Uncharacterized protein n=1 Tax=Bythopirellula polymerisocia TaxID=2528003 RepID=A0A5C6CTB1_9BACT|nr:hypothetical protein [Bythopirellula polymerisocia]TWU27830.1 hypothetical protein Pla144_26070 [Bythopirellula polymerisocia]
MAIPRRAQAPTVPLTRTAETPLFLADLPHVGDKPAVIRQQPASSTATSMPGQPAASTHPAFAEIAATTGRTEKTVSRREQLEQRFVDEAHLEAKTLLEEQEAIAYQQVQQKSKSRPGLFGWRKVFSQAHHQLAPFAGLIVTLALLSSAGLLYWLIARGQPTSFDLRDFDLNDGSLSVQVSESEPPASAIPLIETQRPAEVAQESTDAKRAASPAPSPEKPEVESQVPETKSTAAMPLGSIHFPTTNFPMALDWSKAFNDVAQPQVEINGLPEVAEVSSPESPMAR